MGRRPCCAKEGLNRGAWSAREDAILTEYIKTHGEGKWRDLPKSAGLKRCGKSCRLRWLNYLRPDIKRGNISDDEEALIIKLHKLLGNRWSLIAGRLPGRTDNEIKNYWNTNLSKKMKPQKPAVKNINGEKEMKKFESSSNMEMEPQKVIKTKAIRCTTKIYIPPPQTISSDNTSSPFSLPSDLNIEEMMSSLHEIDDLFNFGNGALDLNIEEGDPLESDVVSEMRDLASLLDCEEEEWRQN